MQANPLEGEEGAVVAEGVDVGDSLWFISLIRVSSVAERPPGISTVLLNAHVYLIDVGRVNLSQF